MCISVYIYMHLYTVFSLDGPLFGEWDPNKAIKLKYTSPTSHSLTLDESTAFTPSAVTTSASATTTTHSSASVVAGSGGGSGGGGGGREDQDSAAAAAASLLQLSPTSTHIFR